LLLGAAGPGPPRTLDDFEDIGAWRASPSQGVTLDLSSAEGVAGKALRLDFDFHGRAGWAAVRRPVSIDLPENYELSFALRGQALANDLEVKLIDDSRERWWSVRREMTPPAAGRRSGWKKRHFSFAWGTGGRRRDSPRRVPELAVTARTGAGWIAIDDLKFTPLPGPRTSGAAARPDRILVAARLRARARDGRRFRDLVAKRRAGAPRGSRSTSRTARIRRPDDRAGARPVRAPLRRGNLRRRGGVDAGPNRRRATAAATISSLPESESRYVRLTVPDPGGAEIGVREIAVRPLAWSATPNAFFEAIAREAPRGTYPRSFSGEQSYWTVVGADGDTESALLGEDGAVEPSRGSFSVEPFLFLDGKLFS
jgi:hypothetical protein